MAVHLIERLPRNDNFSGDSRYRCRAYCSIGDHEFETSVHALRKIKSCSHCRATQTKSNQEVSWNNFLSSIRYGANSRDIEFNISGEDIKSIFFDQNEKCAYSGYDLILSAGRRTASLDRIDSAIGYVPGNLQFVHKDVNMMKNKMTDREFIQNIESVWSGSLIRGKEEIMSRHMGGKPRSNKGFGVFPGYRMNDIEGKAISRNLDFSVDAEYLHSVYVEQGGLCALSGKTLVPKSKARSAPNEWNLSVDRKDNNSGYIPGNIQLITKQLNLMKYKFDNEYFLDVLWDIYVWRNKSSE